MTKQLMFCLALCLCGAGFASAAPSTILPLTDSDPLIVRTSAETDGIRLFLANLEGVTTNLKLTSLENDEVIFEEQVYDHNGYSYDLNFSDLEFGRYILSIKKNETLRQQVILISEHGVWLSQIK